MMKKLLLCVVLASALTGCRTLGSRPPPDACPEPRPVPKLPPIQVLQPGTTPTKGTTTHIVAGLCQGTGTFLSAGVDSKTGRFTYLVTGERTSRESFLSWAYNAGVPVVLYTRPTKVSGGSGSTGSAVVASAATTQPPTSPEDEPTFDPCASGTQIGDTPPKDPDDTGGAVPKEIEVFSVLAWTSANAVDGVSETKPAPTTGPAPGTSVPR
ncbi:hypothetical protein [Pyxidicoccus xibeiensis]|uniref:hypothetical protein n=1 Tax=Pyxidicoccus xibeiensis TaxID=2906759 RepID=UPI0020A76A63|nr:hypothetical protein [Pyxidicoccus xibeiensis]MCP3139268.1 hypothetical protein [Pyxidicoccus xibeiensis]